LPCPLLSTQQHRHALRHAPVLVGDLVDHRRKMASADIAKGDATNLRLHQSLDRVLDVGRAHGCFRRTARRIHPASRQRGRPRPCLPALPVAQPQGQSRDSARAPSDLVCHLSKSKVSRSGDSCRPIRPTLWPSRCTIALILRHNNALRSVTCVRLKSFALLWHVSLITWSWVEARRARLILRAAQ